MVLVELLLMCVGIFLKMASGYL